jgi:hypothetical protein
VQHHRQQERFWFSSDDDSFYDRETYSDYPYERAGRSRDTLILRDGVRQGWQEGHARFHKEYNDQQRLATNTEAGNVQPGRNHRFVSQKRAQAIKFTMVKCNLILFPFTLRMCRMIFPIFHYVKVLRFAESWRMCI